MKVNIIKKMKLNIINNIINKRINNKEIKYQQIYIILKIEILTISMKFNYIL